VKKTIIRGVLTVAAAAAVFGLSAGTASAETTSASGTGVTCPAQLPANPSTGDLVNAWNTSGACLGGGAAGLVSSAWVGAIPTFANGLFFGSYR
jgi:hypothetical protein